MEVGAPRRVSTQRPRRDSNSRRRLEKPMSWARLDDGDRVSAAVLQWPRQKGDRKKRRPRRDSNSRRRLEKPMSWARLDDGDSQ